MKTSFPIDGIALDRDSSANLHRQLYVQLRDLIERRVLPSGHALPSTRVMARDLHVGRNTVIAACDQLALEGYLAIRPRRPSVVMDLPTRSTTAEHVSPEGENPISLRGQTMLAQPYHHGRPGMLAFHPGMPDPDNFPFNTWSKLLSRRTKFAHIDLFGTYHVKGYPPLCEAIARYLTASRGVKCNAEQIVVTNGAQSAFDLLARLLIDEGDTVWMEEPGYYGAGSAFVSAGAKLAPLRVGNAGWNLDPPPVIPRMIFVTPSCHHPLGVTMPMEQRLNLLHMAETWRSWIIEDDYDGEYRFQGQPIPALQGIGASNRVVYVGTFAKILFPAMRLGFLVVPKAIDHTIVSALSVTGQFAPLLTQAALADFMNEGHFTRHLRRMRRLYAERRQFFLESSQRHLGEWLDFHATESGIQVVGIFRETSNDAAIAEALLQQGINVSALSIQYRHGTKQNGLVMGFAAADAQTTEKTMQKFRALLKAHFG
ncbi:PLP-dependent aminotransferase family protein [Mesorhizobium kowhaii]|uniref:Transcriptional regulator n=1 Tax=Mesorhizobium kowhaii TaxID=1300272 RepID=A0A2W7C820_9HYPH|nr:PLP-dependent aminotransferase family protein [Mesorhizobium kowhaii]PZV39255.1 transcriptional regulator [Mesorhizobium kowhaii]